MILNYNNEIYKYTYIKIFYFTVTKSGNLIVGYNDISWR